MNMPWPRSLRTRFALGTVALLLGLLIVFGVFVYTNFGSNLQATRDASLAWGARQVAGGLQVADGQIHLSGTIDRDKVGGVAFEADSPTLVVLSADGRVLQSDGPFDNVSVPPRKSGTTGSFTSLSLPGETAPLRVYSLPVLENGQVAGWVQVMQSQQSMDESLQELLLLLVVGGSLLSVLAGLGGYFLAGRALAPIATVTHTAAQISSEDLSARLEMSDSGEEVGRLAATFNGMLARLEKSFLRERKFTADASHELRTPLAAMQAILAVMRQGEHPVEEYRCALDDLAAEAERLHTLVEDLLRLARGESDGVLHPEPLDLAVLLADVAETLRPLANAKGLVLRCELPEHLPFMGDADALIRLFVNLLDNAIKYTFKGSVILRAGCEDDSICVEVADTGIGIPAEHLPYIFERFYRVEADRKSGGSGLGLAISRQLARSAGGRIEVRSMLGAGTTFLVLFPARGTHLPSA